MPSNLPPGSELWLIGLAAFGFSVWVLNRVSGPRATRSVDEWEDLGRVNGIRLRRVAARRRR